ncbi:MAG: choice-of-anchor A family protein [Puniceicoccaceae bacterium]
MRISQLLVTSLPFVLTLTLPAQDTFDWGAEGFNLFTLEDATYIYSDVEGSVAIGGDFYSPLGGTSIGNMLPSGRQDPALVVGGDLTWGGYGGDIFGEAYVGGTVVQVPGYFSISGSLPSDFYFAQKSAQLLGLNAAIANEVANASAAIAHSTLTLSGDKSTDNILNLSSALFNDANSVSFEFDNLALDAVIVLNIDGSETGGYLNLSGGWFTNDILPEQVLINLVNVSRLDMYGIGMVGSILAPGTDVYFNGQMNGQLIARSLYSYDGYTTGELHDYRFRGFVPAVPEPSTAIPVVGSVLLTLLLVFRKRLLKWISRG